MTLDFTLEKYTQLCESLASLPHPIMTVNAFLESGQPRAIVLRHDVDRGMRAALRMAELEAQRGIAATYYVRAKRTVFKPAALRALHELGHEVGYHYEVLAKARGDTEQAIALFEDELRQFRAIVPIRTISMHGSPLSPWNNLDLWQTYNVESYDIKKDIYSAIDYKCAYYFTDTGRRWDRKFNLRDQVESQTPDRKIVTTDDLIGFLNHTQKEMVLVNVHPNRWSARVTSWVVSNLLDWSINFAKGIIAWRRGLYRDQKGKNVCRDTS
jgi:hypothetical protein